MLAQRDDGNLDTFKNVKHLITDASIQKGWRISNNSYDFVFVDKDIKDLFVYDHIYVKARGTDKSDKYKGEKVATEPYVNEKVKEASEAPAKAVDFKGTTPDPKNYDRGTLVLNKNNQLYIVT